MKKILTILLISASLLHAPSTLAAGGGPGTSSTTDEAGVDLCKVGEIITLDEARGLKDKAAEDFVSKYDKLTDAQKKGFNEVLVKKSCPDQTPYFQIVSSSAAGNVQKLPSFFDGEDAPCEVIEDSINCNEQGNMQVSTLRLPTCELFEQALNSEVGKKTLAALRTKACTELLDPLPPTYFGSDVICVTRTTAELDPGNPAGGTGMNIFFQNAAAVKDNSYCHAILSSTGTGFGGFFGIVRLLYDISLPILIALAVISMVGVGVFIMYAPGGADDSVKKAKTMAIRIFSGLMLLLFLRVFLSLISVDFFGEETCVNEPNSSVGTNCQPK